jgi:hypothetical protein
MKVILNQVPILGKSAVANALLEIHKKRQRDRRQKLVEVTLFPSL